MRVVIDTNVWISAIVFGGVPREILDQCIRAKITIVVSKELLIEMRRIIQRKFPQFAKEEEYVLAIFAQNTQVVQLGSMRVDACRDPDDNMVLETAIIGKADIIISGDKDLLVLGQYKNVKILPPSKAFTLMRKRD